MKGKNSIGDDLLVATSLGITFYTIVGDNPLNSTGNNLPKSTGDDSPNSTGEAFSDCAGENFQTPQGIYIYSVGDNKTF